MDGLWFRVWLPAHRRATRAATLNRRKPNDRPLFLADRKRQEDRYSSRGVGAPLQNQTDQYRPRGPAHSRIFEDFSERPEAVDRRRRADGRRRPDVDFQIRADYDVSRRKDWKVLSTGPARQIRCRSVGRLAIGQSGSQAGRARPFPTRRREWKQRRSQLRLAPLRQ